MCYIHSAYPAMRSYHRSASSGPVENIHPAILMSKNIDLYNIILLRSIDVITSSFCIVNIDVFVIIR